MAIKILYKHIPGVPEWLNYESWWLFITAKELAGGFFFSLSNFIKRSSSCLSDTKRTPVSTEEEREGRMQRIRLVRERISTEYRKCKGPGLGGIE
jgi:hypothetical protein